jgi:outer membrane lipoprotein-sorting protein
VKIALTLQLAALVLAAATAVVAQQSPDLKATLAQLDASAAKFTSGQAKLTYDNFTYIVKDHDMQNGITYAKKGHEVGIKLEGHGARTILFKDGKARDYNPVSDCYTNYDVSKSRGTIDSLFALSFGASGKDLDAAWNIKDLGSEMMDTVANGKTVSVKVEKLDLVPKDPGLKNNIAHITLWTDLSRAVALKYIDYAPNKDAKTAVYSEIKVNEKVDTKPFDFKGKPCSK